MHNNSACMLSYAQLFEYFVHEKIAMHKKSDFLSIVILTTHEKPSRNKPYHFYTFLLV